jgi:hypothetical protein
MRLMELLTVLTLVIRSKTRIDKHFPYLHTIHEGSHPRRRPVECVVVESPVQKKVKVPPFSVGGVRILKLPMGSSNHTIVDKALCNRQALSDFHDIEFPSGWPSNRPEVLSQSPKGRPETLFDIGDLDQGLRSAILEHHLVLRLDTSGCKACSNPRGSDFQETTIDVDA